MRAVTHDVWSLDRPAPVGLRPAKQTIMITVITVGFHNFNLRILNLRVSNPSKLIVDVLLTRCRTSMCQGLGPKKHDEISEIDGIVIINESSPSPVSLLTVMINNSGNCYHRNNKQ